MHRVLAIFYGGTFDNCPATILTQSMKGSCFVCRNIYTDIVQNSADSGLSDHVQLRNLCLQPPHILDEGTVDFSNTAVILNSAAQPKYHSPSWLPWFLDFWISLIYSVRVFIVLLVCSWVFKKTLMSCVLFKGCNVSSV